MGIAVYCDDGVSSEAQFYDMRKNQMEVKLIAFVKWMEILMKSVDAQWEIFICHSLSILF
jgi:hypothetical protein